MRDFVRHNSLVLSILFEFLQIDTNIFLLFRSKANLVAAAADSLVHLWHQKQKFKKNVHNNYEHEDSLPKVSTAITFPKNATQTNSKTAKAKNFILFFFFLEN